MDRSVAVFKKMDRVRVTKGGRFADEVGTVIMVSDWVLSPDPALHYIVDLDWGFTVTCGPEDIELYEEDEND